MSYLVLSGVVDKSLEELQRRSKAEKYKDDPVLWAEEVLGKHLWSKQKEVAYSVRDNPRTAVRSCNNAGKTSVAGVVGAWFIATRDVNDTIVVCTAPGFAQIKTNLFHEFGVNIRAAKERDNPLPGTINVGQNIAEWKNAYGGQLALGRRPADKDAISHFQGIHRANVLVIIDEAGGIPADLFVAAERITTTGNARILAIGNPDRLGSEFHKMFSDESDWNKIHISGYDTPNFTGEDFPDHLRGYMLQPEWVERQRRVWGEDDARFKVSILGEFPDSDDSVFFPQSIIDRGVDTDIGEDNDYPIQLGVDLALRGDDSSCIYIYQNGYLRKHEEWSKATAVESANRVHQAAINLGATVVKIDGGGLGGPIIDNILTMNNDRYTVVAMMGSGATPDARRWHNARAYNYDTFREKLATGELDIDIGDTDLITQMRDINYDITPKGSILMESKRDMKSRGGKSPDHLDAAVYAAANVDYLLSGAPQPGDKLSATPDQLLTVIPSYLNVDAW